MTHERSAAASHLPFWHIRTPRSAAQGVVTQQGSEWSVMTSIWKQPALAQHRSAS